MLKEELSNAGIRTVIDEGDERPGAKFFKWELKGVPLRLELGMRDVEKGVVSFARRDTGGKGTFKRDQAAQEVRSLLSLISTDMRKKATDAMRSSIITVDTLEKIPEKILRFGWCGAEDCGRKIEATTELKILGTPYIQEEFHGKCLGCGKDTGTVVYAARAM